MICALAALSLGAPGWVMPITLTGIAFTGLILWAYRSADAPLGLRVAAAGLKATAIVLLLLCLLDPLQSTPRPRPGANQFAVVIDNSQSMTIEGRGLPVNDQFRDWLGSNEDGWLAELERNFDVRVYSFDRDIRALTDADALDFSPSHSNLNAALRSVKERLQQRPLAGLLLVSDGNATDQPTDRPKTFDAPIYCVLPPTPQMPVDLALKDVSVSETLFETSPTTVSASVIAHGLAGRQIDVQLIDTRTSKIVETKDIRAGNDGEPAAVKFEFRPDETGLSFFQLRVAPAPGKLVEATTENNQRTVLVNRGGGPFRVLYVAGRPNWEFKFLRRALEKDEEVQLVSLLRIAKKAPKFAFRDQSGTDTNRLFEGFDERSKEEEETYDQPVLVRLGVKDSTELAEGFPATEDALYQYDAVIIDDLEAAFFSPDQLMLLRRFVSERGGGLMMLGGMSTHGQGGYAKTPLGELLPIYLNQPLASESQTTESGNPLYISITREGMLETWARLRATETAELQRIKSMPAFRTLNRVGQIKPGALAIAEVHDGDQAHPAIVAQRFGRGRTAAVLLGDLWRWSMRRDTPNDSKPSDHDAAIFWRQAARWLVSDVPRRVTIDIAAPAGGRDPVIIRTQVRDASYHADDNASVSLTVQPPKGDSIEVSTRPGEGAGVYEAEYWPDENGGYTVTARVLAADGSPLPPRSNAWVFAPSESEFDPMQINRGGLIDLAEQSQGGTVSPERMSEFVKELETRPVPVSELRVAPLWHQAWVFGAATLLLCCEWGLRRWKGFA